MRLIVLSKTHEWGQLRAGGTKLRRAPTHALRLICQTMMSTQVRPPNALHSSGERQRRTDPSIYDVIRRTRAEPGAET